MTDIKLALAARAELGECPRWHSAEKRLYWVDISKRTLHRFDPETGKDECRVLAEPAGCFAFCSGGGFILAMKSGFALMDDWASEPAPFGKQIFADDPDRRFNDGRTDLQGRFWAGSVNTAKSASNAALYRLNADGDIQCIEGGMMTCNGAAFDKRNGRFYLADTPTHALHVYDYDEQAGSIANRRVFYQFPLGHGRPDGGSVDAEGCYWTALFDGGRVVRLSPDREILREIILPVSRPTMIAFGGTDLRTAYVTSARQGIAAEKLLREPEAGAIFSFAVEVPGIAEVEFNIHP